MPIPSKRRLLFSCATSLLIFPAAVFAAGAAHPYSWFDRQLDRKTQSFVEVSKEHDSTGEVLACALLDEIFDLRERVSEPERVDSLLARFGNDVEVLKVVQAEAQRLAHRDGVSFAADQSFQQLTNAAIQSGDPKARMASAAILFFHHSHTENGDDSIPSSSPDDWYLTSRAAPNAQRRSEGLRRVLELDPDYIPAVIDLARQYSAQSQITRAETLLSAALQHNPGEPTVLMLQARMLINQGRSSGALAIMNRLSSERLSIEVARELAEAYAQLGFLHQARAIAHYAAARNPAGSAEHELLSPVGATVSEPMNAAAGSDLGEEDDGNAREASLSDSESQRLRRILRGNSPATKTTAPLFADVQELISNWHALSSTERQESRMLADIRVDQLHADYRAVQQVQQVIAIGAASDATAFRERGIQYSGESQQLSVARARLHRADGRIVDGDDLGESAVGDAAVAAYYDLRERKYRFRDLKAGDVIELEYTISPAGNSNPYGDYFARLLAFGGPIRYDLQRYTLRAPQTIHLSSAEHLLGPPQLGHENNENVFVWEKKNIAALVREPRSPPWSEQGAYVHVSNFDSWDSLGRWYAQLLQPQFKLNAELEKQAAKLTKEHPNRLDRVEAIDELVLKSTRYVALELGVYGFKPYPVTETFARRFGDCKDKASLMVALLRATGIDADLALVRTQQLGEILAQPASASIFDHAIVYVPEFDLWLDGTAEFARLRELPVEDQNVIALTVNANGESMLRRTPSSSAADNYSRRTINAQLAQDGTIHFSGATYVRGEDAPELRKHLEPREAKVGYVRDRLAQVLPAVEVRDVELPVPPAEAVSLTFDGDLATFRGQRRAALPSSWMERNYLATLATAASSRTQDLLLDAPWTTEEEIHIQLPLQARVTSLPESARIATKFGSAQLEYSAEGSEITIVTKVQFSQTRITPTEFPAFREFTASVDRAFRRNVEVELP